MAKHGPFKEYVERARSLHHASIVVDTTAPRPYQNVLLTDEYLQMLQKLVNQGLSRHAARQEVGQHVLEMMENDVEFRGSLEELIRSSGVSVMSLTHAVGDPPSLAFPRAIQAVSYTHRLLQMLPGLFAPVLSPEDIQRVHEHGLCGLLLNFQNTLPIGDDIRLLDVFYNLGVRVIQLTYNLANLVGSGCTERHDGGLTHFGASVIERMNALGIIVDVSHCGPRTTSDAVAISKAPIAITHSFAHALRDHPRGKTDDIFKAVAEKGGYIGVCVVPFFLSSAANASVTMFAEHVAYIADVVGVEHVGIGTDFSRTWEFPGGPLQLSTGEVTDWTGWRPEHRYGVAAKVEGLSDYGELTNLTAALLARGFDDEETKRIIGENFVRFYRRVWNERAYGIRNRG